MKNCPFCLENNILKGEILAQNDLCYFVESIDSVLNNSGMIISKRHVESPWDFNDDEWLAIKELFLLVKAILDRSKPDGYNIGWNIGQAAGQNISHAHLHVIARFKDEPLAGKGIRYAFKQESNKRPKL
ncbi:MAG: HIT domain-containing protein [Patescibacteria group bacterium]|nr:HIT domain-containing protein [Patescibacteria group bacterium]